MERFSGFIQNGYRFEVLVATTIFDEQIAVIDVYKNNKKVACDAFYLQTMPKWDVPGQGIVLSKKDMNKLEKMTESIMGSLPSLIR